MISYITAHTYLFINSLIEQKFLKSGRRYVKIFFY